MKSYHVNFSLELHDFFHIMLSFDTKYQRHKTQYITPQISTLFLMELFPKLFRFWFVCVHYSYVCLFCTEGRTEKGWRSRKIVTFVYIYWGFKLGSIFGIQISYISLKFERDDLEIKPNAKDVILSIFILRKSFEKMFIFCFVCNNFIWSFIYHQRWHWIQKAGKTLETT